MFVHSVYLSVLKHRKLKSNTKYKSWQRIERKDAKDAGESSSFVLVVNVAYSVQPYIFVYLRIEIGAFATLFHSVVFSSYSYNGFWHLHVGDLIGRKQMQAICMCVCVCVESERSNS